MDSKNGKLLADKTNQTSGSSISSLISDKRINIDVILGLIIVEDRWLHAFITRLATSYIIAYAISPESKLAWVLAMIFLCGIWRLPPMRSNHEGNSNSVAS